MIREGLGVPLLDLSDKRNRSGLVGIDALRSVVATSRKLVSQTEGQRKAELLVTMLRRSLVWINTSEPKLVAQRAVVSNDNEREDIVAVLSKTPRIYSSDARFYLQHVHETDMFLRSANSSQGIPPAINLIDSRWAGTLP